jgi:hypothetical protein
MNEKKYLIANIKIPIEVKENGSIEPLKDYINIEFSKCSELPKKQDTQVNYAFVMNNIKNLLSEEATAIPIEKEREVPVHEEEQKIMVLKSEIKNKVLKNNFNTSFKVKPKSISRYSIKNR